MDNAMQKKLITVVALVACFAVYASFAQEPAPAGGDAPAPAPAAPAEQPAVAPAAPAESSDGSAMSGVKATLEREKMKREREKNELLVRERELQDKVTEFEAEERELLAQIPALQKSLDEARAKEQEAYATLTKVGDEYNTAEAREKQEFKARILAEANAKNETEYRTLLARHEKDTAFVARNRWTREDFHDLVLVMDPENPSRKIRFRGRGDDSISGSYPTVNFDTGKKTWHDFPGGASFSVKIGGENPFLADISVHPGSDTLSIGSTNTVDWDIHIHIAKDFQPAKDATSRFRLVAVAWPVDIGRKSCWQVGDPPMFEPTPKPELKVATEETPEIKKQIEEWTFKNPGHIQKLADAKMELKQAKQLVRVTQARVPKVEERVKRKLADIAERKREVEVQLEEVQNMLEEYKDDTVTPPAEEGADDLENAGAGAGAGGGNAGGLDTF